MTRRFIVRWGLASACALTALTRLDASVTVPADHPYIQYFGRWDFTDPAAPTHSWPGVYLSAVFEGTSIGVRLADATCYYNVFIDGELKTILHGDATTAKTYTVATGLAQGVHTLLFTKRNETTGAKFPFLGLALDDGMPLWPPPARPVRKIEFVGDSFTSASGNEYWAEDKPANDAPITNVYEGFGPIVARHYGAQVHLTSRAGYGLVMSWDGNTAQNMPDCFDWAHVFTPQPKWDFSRFVPNLVVIGLGLNDYNAFGGWQGPVAPENTALYIRRYHDFLSVLRDVYPGVHMLCVAAHAEWMQQAIQQVVDEERSAGHADVHNTFYPKYDSGYVYGGHPTVATHHKIADALIAAIDTMNVWTPAPDAGPPAFVNPPVAPFTVYDSKVLLKVETDQYATVRYGFEDRPYAGMEHPFTVTGRRRHSVEIPCEHGVDYAVYLRAIDPRGNASDTSTVIRFRADTTKVKLDWTDPGYDDSAWGEAVAPAGNRPGATVATPVGRAATVYFRKTVSVRNAAGVKRLTCILRGSDGCVLYLNGIEVTRINMTDVAEVSYDTPALISKTCNASVRIDSTNALSSLVEGDNVIAAEMHSAGGSDPGITFDMQARTDRSEIPVAYGGTWKFDDGGRMPDEQIRDRQPSAVEETASASPRLELGRNYPNPFNSSTLFRYTLDRRASVRLDVTDVLGRKVAALESGTKEAGEHTAVWNAEGLGSGVYFVTLEAEGLVRSMKTLLIR
jgi:hypothetical protein